MCMNVKLYFSYLNLYISSILLKGYEMWHLYFVAQALPSSMLGSMTAFLMYLSCLTKQAVICDGVNYTWFLALFIFPSIRILELWEKSGEVKHIHFLVVDRSTNKIPFFFRFSSKFDPKIRDDTLYIFHVFRLLCLFTNVIFSVSCWQILFWLLWNENLLWPVYPGKNLSKFCDIEWKSWNNTLLIKKYILDKKICISFLTGVQFSPSFVKMFAVLEYAMDLCSWPCLDKADLNEYLPLSHTLLEIWLIGLTGCHQ